MLRYRRTFDPPGTLHAAPPPGSGAFGDQQDGAVYVFTEAIVLAVNVAIAARRPLLVSGEPGSGKSSLAAGIAASMDWRYEAEFVTPRTQARDLLWEFDALRRLRDAQTDKLRADHEYVNPGVLWRAFDSGDDQRPALVLLDEIDKADPDVPNSLLEALGSLSFHVAETGTTVSAKGAQPPFVMLTTNNERELPRPFLRRCVALVLPEPDRDRLLAIAAAHGLADDAGVAGEMVDLILRLRLEAKASSRASPSAAELLDALRACKELEIAPGTPEWETVAAVTLTKDGGAPL